MNNLHFNTHMLTHTAIAALQNAYHKCSDTAAKESIITAFKAIMQMQNDFGQYNNPDNTSENESGFDPSEYCSAV